MAEMGLHFRLMMRTLREARHAVQAELDLQTSASSPDAALLVRLRASATEFAQQARTLIVVMQEHGVGEALTDEAEGLAKVFRGAELRISSLLEASQRVS